MARFCIKCGGKPNGIQGVSFAQFTAAGTGASVKLQDNVSFTYSSPTPSNLPGPYSVPLNFVWPGDTSGNNSPSAPSISGPTVGTTGTWYTWSVASTDNDGDILQYTFIWGDGTSSYTTDWYASGLAAQWSHIYSNTGTYSITVTTQDSAHLSASSSYQVIIPCTVGASPTTGIWQVTVQFSASCNFGTGSYSYVWHFNDGSGQTSTSQNPQWTYYYTPNPSRNSAFYPTVTVTSGSQYTLNSTVIVVRCGIPCPVSPSP